MPLYHKALQLGRGRIAAGDYSADAALPTDEALIREFGVSRHTVRTALQQLVAGGLIDGFAGRGALSSSGRGGKDPDSTARELEAAPRPRHPGRVVLGHADAPCVRD